MTSKIGGISQHDIYVDLHKVKTILSLSLKSVIIPESVITIQNRYLSLLTKYLKIKRPRKKFLIDTVSNQLIENENLREYIGNLHPVVNSGTGNCFYKAISIFFVGTEDLSFVLRLLASIELFTNSEFYVKYFTERWMTLGISAKNLTNFQYILSHAASARIFSPSDYIEAFRHESINNSVNCTYVSFVFLPVLSKILSCSINLVYAKRATSFFRILSGNYCAGVDSCKLTLMYTKSTINVREPDHFVCCLPEAYVCDSLPQVKTISRSEEVKSIGNKIIAERQSKLNFFPQTNEKASTSNTQQTTLKNLIISDSDRICSLKQSKIQNESLSISSNVSAFDKPKRKREASGNDKIYKFFSGIKKPINMDCHSIETKDNAKPSSLPSDKLVSSAKDISKDSNITTNIIESKSIKGCKKINCLSCGDNRIERGNPVIPSSMCDKYDFGLHYKSLSSLSRQERMSLADNVWKPDKDFDFPYHFASQKHQRMSWDYLNPESEHYLDWLVYSKYLDGCFCLFCSLFGQFESDFNKLISVLVKKPFHSWNIRARSFKSHLSSQSHIVSASIYNTTVSQLRGSSQGIDEANKKEVIAICNKNYTKIEPIMKTVILCGLYGIPLRGKRDDSRYYNDPNFNAGVFQGLLNYRMDGGDKVLEEHFRTAPKNKTQRSKTVQNQMIDTCKKYIQNKIITKIRKIKFFSIIADEATDISNKTQLSLVLRYVDPDSYEIQEDFFGFIECELGTSGAALATIIEKELTEAGLNLCSCRGQCYDGAGSMKGCRKGLSTLLNQKYPKIISFHCAGHKLNLCVVLACTIPSVQTFMHTIRKCTEIFRFSPKKSNLYKDVLAKSQSSTTTKVLKNVCRTRWLERIDGMERVLDHHRDILIALKLIGSDFNGSYLSRNCRAEADGVHAKMESFDFIIILIIVRKLLAYVHSLTYEVQKVSLDVVRLFEAVRVVTNSLQEVSENLDKHHHDWFVEASEIALKNEIEIKLKWNFEKTPVEEYYKINISRPFLDFIINSLKQRFSDEHKIYLHGSYILPNSVLSEELSTSWMQHVCEFAEKYSSDLPKPFVLKEELLLWKKFWEDELKMGKTLPSTISSTLLYIKHKIAWFPNVKTILVLIATCPGTSVSSERSFSKLRLLKTYVRNSMSNSRLTGLTLINVHRNIGLNVKELMDLFCRDYKKTLYVRHIFDDAHENSVNISDRLFDKALNDMKEETADSIKSDSSDEDTSGDEK